MKRQEFKEAKRIVIKIGSSSLTHKETGDINYRKLEQLVRILSDLKNQGKEIVLVTSGAQAVGRQVVLMNRIPEEIGKKQALSAIGQAKLMMTYQRLFSEYHQNVAQVLLTKDVMVEDKSRFNAINTFEELLKMGVIPIVNENDTVSTDEIMVGDNDRLSAFVVALIQAEGLIILSDIDGFYTDDPQQNKDAQRIPLVEKIERTHHAMGKDSSTSTVGTGGMTTKLNAAEIATKVGASMVLMSSDRLQDIYRVFDGDAVGTLFLKNVDPNFDIKDWL